MVPEDSVALQLRFRDHEGSHEPPDVKAFGRPRPPLSEGPPRRARSERVEQVGLLGGGGRLEPSTPFVMFFRHTAYAIPAPARSVRESLPDLASWSLRPTVFGWLASVP